MNIKPNMMVVVEPNHPHYDLIKNKYVVRGMEEAIASYETYDVVIDLTILRSQKKLVFLRELARTSRAQIISDLTCTYQEAIFKYIPQVKASVSSFFYSPSETIEFFLRENLEEHTKKATCEIITDFFNSLNLKTRESKVLEITFTLPRVVTQIINEAYYSLEENLATPEDIDSSMIHGVSYPIGPILWAQKSGKQNVLHILEELYTVTHDARYRPSLRLIKECL